MKINIDLNNDVCEAILSMNGYVSEDVTAYFNASTDPYNSDFDPRDLRGSNIKVAYHRMDRPEELDKEYPMLYALNDYRYEKVVEKLFSSRLCDIFFNFKHF